MIKYNKMKQNLIKIKYREMKRQKSIKPENKAKSNLKEKLNWTETDQI